MIIKSKASHTLLRLQTEGESKGKCLFDQVYLLKHR